MLNKESFAHEFISALMALNNEVELVFLNELEVITNHKGKETKHFLDNAYAEYSENPDQMQAIVGRYASSTLDIYTMTDDVNLDCVVPIIKDVRFLKELQKLQNSMDIFQLYEIYNEELVIFYAQDLENSIKYMTKVEFEGMGISLEALKAKSIENLLGILTGKVGSYGEEGFHFLVADGHYDPSTILLDDVWKSEFWPVKGDLVIAIPSRSKMGITGSEDEAGLESLKKFVQYVSMVGDHHVSSSFFIRKNNKFEVFPMDF